MEQTKALNALEPFLLLCKSATSPRAAADLVTRATSAPNTYFFTELLQMPQIQALATSEEFAPYLELLRIFSYGTYSTYHATPNLPALSDEQTLKLRQLSILTLARHRSNLSYDALQYALGLSSTAQLENIVVRAVYAGLLDATLDPARQAVQVTRLAPLRDLHPGAIPSLIEALDAWEDRCATTLVDIGAKCDEIHAAALRRAQEKLNADRKLKTMWEPARVVVERDVAASSRSPYTRKSLNKRGVPDVDLSDEDDETMEIDDFASGDEQAKCVGKRRL